MILCEPAPWRIALILVVGLLWPWPLAAVVHLDHYTIRAAFFAGAWTFGALAVGFVWGEIARRFATSLPVVMIALLPAVVVSTFLLERQRVPNAVCAERVEFHIGDLQLTVPRNAGIRSVVVDGAPAQDWEGAYGSSPSIKPHVRALCRATEGGTAPLAISHAWMSFNWHRRELESICENAERRASKQEVCDALERTQPTVLQFYARPDGLATPTLSHFNYDRVNKARAEGVLEGYHCKDSTNGPRTRYCTVWQEMTPKVLAVSTVKLGPFQDSEDPLADSIVLLNELTRRLNGN